LDQNGGAEQDDHQLLRLLTAQIPNRRHLSWGRRRSRDQDLRRQVIGNRRRGRRWQFSVASD
jgi:hypothetical protein